MKYNVIIVLILSLACPLMAQTLPLSVFFVANEGQWEEPFAFKLSNGGATWFVTESGMTMDFRQYDRPIGMQTGGLRGLNPPLRDDDDRLEPVTVRGHVLKMNFLNANTNPQLHGEEKLTSYSNYFIGRDPCKWRSFVGHYQRILVLDVWPWIDVEYRARAEGVETLYHVKPGADVNRIQIEYEGLDAPLHVDNQGNLVLQTSLGEVIEKAPFAYQNDGNKQTHVRVQFMLIGNNKYALACESYDAGKELLIDPLIYSTYFGGGDGINEIKRAPDQTLVISGTTLSTVFPITPGAYQELNAGIGDCFVTKLTQDGRQIVFSTYIGGNNDEGLGGLTVGGQGSVYIAGYTLSLNWPLTVDAFDFTFAGSGEGFFSRLSSTGSTLEFSSFIGGGGDAVYDLARDSLSGEIYLCGEVRVPRDGFPLTPDALFSESIGGASFVSIFDPSTSSLAYSTLFPCTLSTGVVAAYSVVPLGQRQIWLSGGIAYGGLLTTEDAFQYDFGGGTWDGFFALLNFASNNIAYCSYIGREGSDDCRVKPLPMSRLLIFGSTNSPDFPVTANGYDTTFGGHFDGFVSQLELPQTLQASTFLGGQGSDVPFSVLTNSRGELYVWGITGSPDFPVTHDAIDTTYSNNPDFHDDGFVCRLSPDLSNLEYGTYLGGWLYEYVISGLSDGDDSLWVAGVTASLDFPVTPDAFQTNRPGSEANFLTHLYIERHNDAASQHKHVPTAFSLCAYPNPFNTSTSVLFTLATRQYVRLRVFDVLGREVRAYPCGATSAGEHRVMFDGSELASGIYFVRLESGSIGSTTKIVLLK